ncbi:MAG TPA: amidohydrolase [Smithellaceae bacterium]|nr:amidohydrolase [Smithellaceae bacterium]
MIRENLAQAITWRRLLHRYPQPSWLEFFATAFIAEKLVGWGYKIKQGREIIKEERQLLPPDEDTLKREYQKALKAGAREEFLEKAQGGFTGVVAELQGTLPGPVVAFRFDIDSNELTEAADKNHRPAREGFRSENPGYAHMCGHDAHMAAGLLLAQYFAGRKEKLKGKIKFIFQPNEENLSGAAAMVDQGILDDVDVLLGGHMGVALKKLGQICFNVHSFMALTRFEVAMTGRPSHAALRPDEGKNAMLGACAAVTNLYAIARHGLGASRINVGRLEAGSTWNIIPDRAYFRMETRGVLNEINDYMVAKAKDVLQGAAAMYDLDLEIKPAAVALSAKNSPELIELAGKIAKDVPSITEVVPDAPFNASEDVTLMMESVQLHGGKAMFVLFGTPIGGGHHNAAFDLDENVIANAAEFMAKMHEALTAPG